ncbi:MULTISPECIES: helix-turn-helix domain-containing protein [unclassified Aureimonas]|uniref:helix-turn-helix domain-containing protein n=1 Tax=unclassified Aureimonas TaxID=2615206 RepID=UPI0006F3AF1D|nr:MULTISPECIES: helix-turn-helix transcriptional regulator [unclassified Aureimonas]KQT69080.1 hypothetical protein ASG54_05385 [Aureimonas sp. Leaf460]KQT69318.1 hypothetical protein ASG62_17990 [Aureimonas sp. Leaf427]
MSDDIHPVDLRVGQNVRRLRMLRGLSQTSVANAVGITFQQIQKYEKGTNRISASMMHDIAKTLDVDILAFFAETTAESDSKSFTIPDTGELFSKLDLRVLEKIARIDNAEIKKQIILLIDAVSTGEARTPADLAAEELHADA